MVKTLLLSEIADNRPILHYYWNQYCLYPYNNRKEETKWVIANKRNSILSELFSKRKITEIDQQVPNCSMFWGWSVEFKYKKNYFCWHADSKIYKWDEQKKQYFPKKDYKISNKNDLLSYLDKICK